MGGGWYTSKFTLGRCSSTMGKWKRCNHRPIIKTTERSIHVNIFPVQNNFKLVDIRHHLNLTYNTQSQSFILHIICGLILKAVGGDDGGRYRAWLWYKNDYLFTRNVYIGKRAHLERAIERIKHMDITTYIMQQRDSTKWIPYYWQI